MAKYYFTKKAIEDLNSIWNYTVNVWSEEQAEVYYRMIIDECNNIITNPYKFSKRYDIVEKDLYGRHIGKHIIFYKSINNYDILIVRILHSSMDLKTQLKN